MHSKRSYINVSFLSFSLFLAACSVVPQTIAPPLITQESFATQSQHALARTPQKEHSVTMGTPPQHTANIAQGLVLSEQQKTQALKNWWQQFENPHLLALIQAAQEHSPSTSTALFNLQSAQSALTIASNASLPKGSIGAASSQSTSILNPNTTQSTSASAQISWELDLFDRQKTNTTISQLEAQRSSAAWHDARALVAAQTAKTYFTYQFCQQSTELLTQSVAALLTQKRLIEALVVQGAEPQSALHAMQLKLNAQQSALLVQQNACVLERNALKALSGLSESALKPLLEPKNTTSYALFLPQLIPAQLLTQRPDVHIATLAVQSAIFQKMKTQLATYPTISFNGQLGLGSIKVGSSNNSGSFWTVGPISISLPILDPTSTQSAMLLADQNITLQRSLLQSTLTQAIKEVDSALLLLSQTQERQELLEQSLSAQGTIKQQAEQKYKVGLLSLMELQEAHLALLTLKNTQLAVQKDYLFHWIDLYKAIGGGFTRD